MSLHESKASDSPVNAKRDVVVIGTSAGGVQALLALVAELDPKLDAAVFIVIHVPPDSRPQLPQLLQRITPLKVELAQSGAPIECGHIYMAPPDHHLLISKSHMILSRGPRENRTRPAIDPLFRSAAEVYGDRVIGVLLTGTLNDGAAGLLEIARRGGLPIVEDPMTALYGEMPLNAITALTTAGYAKQAGSGEEGLASKNGYIVSPLYGISRVVNRSVAKGATSGAESAKDATLAKTTSSKESVPMQQRPMSEQERELVQADIYKQERGDRSRAISIYSCPDCGGVLWEADDEGLLRFRCHVGHTFTVESLYAGQDDVVEKALWSAVRALTERAVLAKQLAHQLRERNIEWSAKHYETRAKDAEADIETIRNVILTAGGLAPSTEKPSQAAHP